MKRNLKRILALALMLVLVMSLSAPAFAADSTISCETGTRTIIMSSTSGSTATFNINYLASSAKSFKLNRADIKIDPGTTGMRLVSLKKFVNSTDTDEDNSGWTSTKNANCHYRIDVRYNNTGTAKITYTINNKNYTLKLKIVPYSNAIKSITFTGVNNDKSFASLTKAGLNPSKDLTLKATTKSAKLNITPGAKWKITAVVIMDHNTGLTKEIGSRNGLSSVSLKWGTLNAKHNYTVSVRLIDAATGWQYQHISYYIKGANA